MARELPGRVYFLSRHKRAPTGNENFTAKALRTPREDGRRKRGEGIKRKNSLFRNSPKKQKTPLLREC
jgi:hypothetical protein